MIQNINWVRALGPKGPARLEYEIELMKTQYPQFDFYRDSNDPSVLYVDGCIITRGKNAFHVRIYFPENFPYCPPIPIVLDQDVIREHESSDIPHNRGIQKGGVALCVIKPDDTMGQPWIPEFSCTSVVKFAGKWLQAYELWKKKNKWYLREA